MGHLLESDRRGYRKVVQNDDDARGELDPVTIQQFNTSVLGLRYRTSVESRWR